MLFVYQITFAIGAAYSSNQDALELLRQSLAFREKITSSHMIVSQSGISKNSGNAMKVESTYEQWQSGSQRRVDVKNVPNGPEEIIPRLTVGLNWPEDNVCIYYASNSRCVVQPFRDRVKHESYFCYCFDSRNCGFKGGSLANADEQGAFDYLLKPRVAPSQIVLGKSTVNGRACHVITAMFPNSRTVEIILDAELDFYPIQLSATSVRNGKTYAMKATRMCERDAKSKVVFAKSFHEVSTIDGSISEDMTYTVSLAEFNSPLPKSVFTLEGCRFPDGTAISNKNDKGGEVMLVESGRIRKDGLKAISERIEKNTKPPSEPIPDRPETQASGRTRWVVSAIVLFVIGLGIIFLRRRKVIES